MKRRLFIQAGAFTSALLTAPFLIAARAQNQAPTGQKGPQKRHKIVIQVSDNDPAKWNLALNNAKNLQDDVGAANVDIEIVAYGPGIGMLKLESPTGSRVADAMKANIKVLACENTMRGQKLTRDDMLPSLSYVPAGVTEIMTKQSEGWAYLRPWLNDTASQVTVVPAQTAHLSQATGLMQGYKGSGNFEDDRVVSIRYADFFATTS